MKQSSEMREKKPGWAHNECGRACVMNYTTETEKQLLQSPISCAKGGVNGERWGGVNNDVKGGFAIEGGDETDRKTARQEQEQEQTGT